MGVTYRSLPQLGMPFVTREDPQFRELVSGISLDPFGTKLEKLPSEAVILLNQSSQAVLVMSFLWRWADREGHVTLQRMPGLHSLAQLDWNSERNKQRSSWFTPFLPGSKRLITSQGIFGDNSDVLPAETKPSGFVPARGAANSMGKGQVERLLLEVQLDSVIFIDGLCVGPDEMGLFDSIHPVAAEQRRLASEAIRLLRSGGRLGAVFELVRAAARHPGPTSTPPIVDPLHLLFPFGRQAVDHLVHTQDEHRDELISWFEAQREQTNLELHRHE